MSDQFEFEPEDPGSEDPDQTESEQAAPDPLDESLDEGYRPTTPWPEPGGAEAEEAATDADHTFEQHLEQEEPEVEDDWDEGPGAIDTDDTGEEDR